MLTLLGGGSSDGSGFGVAWIKALGGSSAESATAITHDAANGAVFLTGDTTSKSLRYDGEQVMYVDPLAANSTLTQDAAVVGLCTLNSVYTLLEKAPVFNP